MEVCQACTASTVIVPGARAGNPDADQPSTGTPSGASSRGGLYQTQAMT
jgi:hypothetical protein